VKHEDHESPLQDAPLDTEYPAPTLTHRVLRSLRIHRVLWLYIFLVELRSLCYRTYWRHKSKLDLRPPSMGPAFQRNKHQGLVRCSRTLARTADTQELYANLPGATLWDVQVFLDGWTAGERWASRNADKESEQEMASGSIQVIASGELAAK
jgi:hypothetical protein